MQIVANEKHISQRKKIGERAPFVGLIFLAGSTVLIFLKPEWIWGTMALVWVGFLISLMGSYLGERYVGPNAHHKRVPEALKGMSNEYTLLMYRLRAPFVLVEPGGLTVISVRSQSGSITYEEGRWRQKQKMGFLRRFAGQESLGRPEKLAQIEREDVEKHLAKALPAGVEVPVRSVVLFTAPGLELRVDEETVPVTALRAAELKRWLRRNPLKPQLVGEAQAALQAMVGDDAS